MDLAHIPTAAATHIQKTAPGPPPTIAVATPAISIARQCDHVRLPAIDHGGGLFWVGFSQGDTAVVVRSTVHTLYPKQWNKSMFAARACCLDAPDVAALPDSTVGVLFGTPEGEVFFVRVRQGQQ